jgi:thiamine transport system substrate-binding protein
MKHFLGFIVVVFTSLFLIFLNRNEESAKKMVMPTLKVFAYESFASQAGKKLKQIFEQDCLCRVEFFSGSDSGILLQRLKIEGENLGADLVIGLDQYDINKALSMVKWRKLNISDVQYAAPVKAALINPFFIPYDWGVLGFVSRKGETDFPKKLNDLLKPEWSKKIAFQDPRTSSPGLQFYLWVLKVKGQEEGSKFLYELIKNGYTFSTSWSQSYGLFLKNQADLVFSYVTSPVYHEVVEQDLNYQFISFDEPLPMQFEYFAVPEFCKQCDLAEKFITLMLSVEGQREIMNSNVMFPVVAAAMKDSPYEKAFEQVSKMKILTQVDSPSAEEVDRLLKKWTEIRRRD